MPKKASGDTKIDRYIEPKSNGIIYVYERKRKYNSEKRYNENLGTRLLGILQNGKTDYYDDKNISPTRPKRKTVPKETSALRQRTGMIDLIRHISNLSGIEEELRAALPGEDGVVQKLLTCAWFLFATDGDSMPKIRSWTKKYDGILPYRHGIITKDMYHALYSELGRREDVKQTIFCERRKSLGDDVVLALDSSTFETSSEQLSVGRNAIHKDKLIKKVYKVVNFYSLDERRPVAFSLVPGNIPDTESVGNALKQLQALDMRNIEIVSDNGYCSDCTVAQMLLAGQHFITRIEADIKWVQPLIARRRRALEHGGGIIDCDPLFSGVATSATRVFTTKEGEAIEAAINVFIYFSSVNKAKDDAYFRETFIRYKHSLLNGTALCDERRAVDAFSDKYMIIRRNKKGEIVSIRENPKEYDKHMRYSGYLVLISDAETSMGDALMKFRKREYIEEEIKNYKSHTGGRKARVWDADTLEGQMLAQFLALTMHESFNSRLGYLKDTLAKPNGDTEHDKADVLKAERRLYNWIQKNSMYDILHWFDAIVTTEVSGTNGKTKWITETTQRDKMFLSKIGMCFETEDEFVDEDMVTE